MSMLLILDAMCYSVPRALEADMRARIVAAAWRARRADRMEALMSLWMSDVPFTDELERQVEFA
jgi:hypothetical protein